MKKTSKGRILEDMAAEEVSFLNSLIEGRGVMGELKVERKKILKDLG